MMRYNNPSAILFPMKKVLVAVIFFLFLVACGSEKAPQPTFIYQLQNAQFDGLAAQNVSALVVDPDDTGWTKEQVTTLRNQNKTVLAYLSIGEAENYRSYWKPDWNSVPPSWLSEENPEWKGNFNVHYWEGEWQQTITAQLNAILALNYSGAYLDKVDAYEYWEDQDITDARRQMLDFVLTVSRTAKNQSPDFLIIPQNAPELVVDFEYLNAIDGIGKEDLWYFDDFLNPPQQIKENEELLDSIKNAGKMVLVTDYPTKNISACDFYGRAAENGYLSYVGNRALDRVVSFDCRT